MCVCETVAHTLNCEFLLKIYHFPSFWKSLSSTKLSPTLSAIYTLTAHRIEVCLYADVLENILPFESQSINWTLVAMTYHKAWTGSVPLWSLMFSWYKLCIHAKLKESPCSNLCHHLQGFSLESSLKYISIVWMNLYFVFVHNKINCELVSMQAVFFKLCYSVYLRIQLFKYTHFTLFTK